MDNFFPHSSLIEEKLGYVFQNKQWLKEAFTHRTFSNENRDQKYPHNERLEFLGDAVLCLLCSEFLFTQCLHFDEGQLSHTRSRLVDASACSKWVQDLGVESFLLLGKGEMMNAGRGRESLFANLFEAILAAIYLDAGLEAVKAFFLLHFKDKLIEMIHQPMHNWKALLQDHYQKKIQKQPIYKVISEEGPAHEPLFEVGVYLDDELLGIGKGLSKKEAEQHAAQKAYRKIH